MASSFFKYLFGDKSSNRDDYSRGTTSYNIGMSFYSKKQYKEALQHLDDAINCGIENAYSVRGLCLQSLEFYLDAIDDYNKAIAITHEDCNLYFCRGNSKHAVGDYAGAVLDGELAVTFSKFENNNNQWGNERAKEQGYKNFTNIYEMQLWTWKMDLESMIKFMDFYNKIKESRLPKDIELADGLLKSRARLWERNLKRREQKIS